MPNAPVLVDFDSNPPQCSPPQVVVTKGVMDGITWTAKQTGYTFLGVNIGGTDAPVGDFGTPAMSTAPGSKHRMSVTDACSIPDAADYVEYTYTLLYQEDASETVFALHPTIRNQR